MNQTLPENQKTKQVDRKIIKLFPEYISKINKKNTYYPEDLFPPNISKEKIEDILTTSINYIFVYDIKPVHNSHLHLLQGLVVKDIYHENFNDFTFPLFSQVYFFDNVYKKINASYKKFDICVIHKEYVSMNMNDIKYDESISNYNKQIQEKEIKVNKPLTSSKELIKIINIVSELYMIDPDMFKNELKHINQKIKLHNDIKNISSNKKDIKNFYSCINLFDECCKNKSYNDSYDYSCKYYHIDVKLLRSIISKRNNYLRNRV